MASTLYTRLRALATSLILDHKDTPQNRSKPVASPERLTEYTKLVGRPRRTARPGGFAHTPDARAPVFPSRKHIEEQKKEQLLLQLMKKKSRVK